MAHENERSIVFWLLLFPSPAAVVAAVVAVPAIAVVVFINAQNVITVPRYERWPNKKKARGKWENHTPQKFIVKSQISELGLSFHPWVFI